MKHFITIRCVWNWNSTDLGELNNISGGLWRTNTWKTSFQNKLYPGADVVRSDKANFVHGQVKTGRCIIVELDCFILIYRLLKSIKSAIICWYTHALYRSYTLSDSLLLILGHKFSTISTIDFVFAINWKQPAQYHNMQASWDIPLLFPLIPKFAFFMFYPLVSFSLSFFYIAYS